METGGLTFNDGRMKAIEMNPIQVTAAKAIG